MTKQNQAKRGKKNHFFGWLMINLLMIVISILSIGYYCFTVSKVNYNQTQTMLMLGLPLFYFLLVGGFIMNFFEDII